MSCCVPAATESSTGYPARSGNAEHPQVVKPRGLHLLPLVVLDTAHEIESPRA